MSKIFKISIIFMLIFNIYTYIAYAETTNLYNDIEEENLNSNTSNSDDENNVENESSIEDDLDPIASSSQTTTTPATTTRVNTVSSIPEANLGLNNVLCIILIAIGALIVLLAIAILIRLNK